MPAHHSTAGVQSVGGSWLLVILVLVASIGLGLRRHAVSLVKSVED